jgi:hypothetical protein
MAGTRRLRQTVWGFRAVCVATLLAGVIATAKTGDDRWVERSGGMLVAMSLILSYVQFRYEIAHRAAEHAVLERASRLVKQKMFVGQGDQDAVLKNVGTTVRQALEAERAYILVNALLTAALGEVVSAFGGLAVQLFSKPR